MSNVTVTIYTDPGCPFGFNAQRQELQLDWHYGHGADVKRVMIGLIEESSSLEERGMTREMLSANAERLRSLYGMPMLTDSQDHLAATIQACRAYVGARLNEPLRADLLLRHLRLRAFSPPAPAPGARSRGGSRWTTRPLSTPPERPPASRRRAWTPGWPTLWSR